jgi:transcriptional regulator with XRE-family HTH domain
MREPEPQTIDQRAAEAVRVLRERHGMSQAALAAEMTGRGVSWQQQTVGRVEAATQALRLRELVALAAIFSVPIERFTYSSPEASASESCYVAIGRMAESYEEVVLSLMKLGSAIKGAERTLKDTSAVDSPRVRDAQGLLAEEIEQRSMQAAVNEGCYRLAEMFGEITEGEEEEGDDGNTESQS